MAIQLNHVTDTITASSGTLNLPGFTGGGLTQFVESENTTAPNQTVPVDALTATDAGYSDIDVAIVPKGAGSFFLRVPDGTASGGNKRGSQSVDLQMSRTASNQVASGYQSSILCGQNNRASGNYSSVVSGQGNSTNNSWSAICGGASNVTGGNYSIVGGGNSNSTNGLYSFVGAGISNYASAESSVICGGRANNGSGYSSFVGGGQENRAGGYWSSVVGGSTNISYGDYSFIGGGYYHEISASGRGAFISGGSYGKDRGIEGYHVFPACLSPVASVAGVSQSALLILGRETTSSTSTVITSNNQAASTNNQLILPNYSAYSFTCEVIALDGSINAARWEAKGVIKRNATAASTTMVGVPTLTMTHYDASASSWTVAITADTVNGGLKVAVAGSGLTTRWVCKINTTEVTL